MVIPSFAVGRTQEMLYYMRIIKEKRLIKGYENFPVYVDSPLAVEATNIFNKNMATCFDEEALNLVNQGINPLTFPGLKIAVSTEESKLINMDQTPKVIISASGMCEAGRIRHHLKHNLWRSESTILFVGYQAVGSLGRRLIDGTDQVKLFGETIEVRATITKLDGVSGHADQEGLIRWLQAFDPKPKKVFIVHGEDSVCDIFADILRKDYGYQVDAPYTGACFDCISGEFIKDGEKEHKEKIAIKRTPNSVYARLLAAG